MTTAHPTSPINTIIHGNCLKVLPRLAAGSVDFILTAPPYVVRFRDRSGRAIKNDNNSAWIKPAFAEMYRVLASDSFCVTFYGWTSLKHYIPAIYDAGFRIAGQIMFQKSYASSCGLLHRKHESAYLLVKGDPFRPENPISDILPWKYSENKFHPTQKHVAILRPLIGAFSKPGDLVLDAFCGSASTLIAAKALGRNYLGIELDSRYYAIAKKRLMRANRTV